ncbi:hypothetical protein HII31_09591 [Pseudocercospora fuligena]|uniref:Uncharacterized protein n=1 Tax=Pseudocercospora fuligena TaxID=685502 RepID=A0A8H6RDY2_9PEZI|nr:hypothetical protein HII31_09591 [Pseudocercospora fuligena]
MPGRSLIALLALGGSCLFARAAPRQKETLTILRNIDDATTSHTVPECTVSSSISGTLMPWCETATVIATSVTTVKTSFSGLLTSSTELSVSSSTPTSSISVSTAFVTPLLSSETSQTSSSLSVSTSAQSSLASSLTDSPVSPSPPPMSTGPTTQLTSDLPVVPSVVPPPFANSTSSSWSIPSVLTSSGMLPTTISSHSSRPTSDVPNVPSTPLTTSESASATQSTSEVSTSKVPMSSKTTSTSKTIEAATSSVVASDNTPPSATSSVAEPEDTSRSVVLSTRFHTETLTTKTTTTDTEYPPVTSVIESTTEVTRTEVFTTTTTDRPLVLSSCGLGGMATDGQDFFSVCSTTLETVTTPVVPPSSSSISKIVDPLETSTTCAEETSKTKPTQHITTGPSMTSIPSVLHPQTPCYYANHDTNHCYSEPIVATNSSTSLPALTFSSSEPKTTAAGVEFSTFCDSPFYASKDTTICSTYPVTLSSESLIPKDPNTAVPPKEHSEYSKTHGHPTTSFVETSASSSVTSVSTVTRHEV